MRKRNIFIICLIVGIAFAFIASGLYASDVIKMQNKAYKKHKEKTVTFQHKKHSEEFAKKYPELYKSGCGECHHDENHKPLSGLKAGDKVKGCIECHKEPGTKPSKEKLSKKEKIKKYHAEALHENCQGCHKAYNKAKKLKSKDKGYAPTKSKCKTCHTN